MSDTEIRPPALAVATLRDVAYAASVSISTASLVLAGSDKPVTEALRARVQDAAKALGYIPNHSAQAMRRRTAPVITLLVSDLEDPHFGRLASGVLRGVEEAGLTLNVVAPGTSASREREVIRGIRAQRPRGLIIAGPRGSDTDHSAADVAALEASGTRVVSIGGSGIGTRRVAAGDLDGARALGMAVALRGNKTALILAGPEGLCSSDDRVAGFTEGLLAAGGNMHEIHHAELSRSGGMQAMAAALDKPLPNAAVIFAVADVMAFGASAVLRANDLAVGRDVGLCGFGEIPSSIDASPPLTTVHIPFEELGREAVLRCLGREPGPQEAVASFELRLRGSTPHLV
jgi:LacI family transcriptional regulator